MIPQELSTSNGIKLMLANMWDAELWSSLWHMVNFIPQELSTSYGIKLMLANMWDAELWSSLWHMVNFIIQKRLQQRIWTLWNNLEWGEWERSTNQRWWFALGFVIGAESCVHLWSHRWHHVIQVVSSPTLRFCDTWCRKLSAWGCSLLWSFCIWARKWVFYPIVQTLRSFKFQPERLVTKTPEGNES